MDADIETYTGIQQIPEVILCGNEVCRKMGTYEITSIQISQMTIQWSITSETNIV
jgi:hypothetical protein